MEVSIHQLYTMVGQSLIRIKICKKIDDEFEFRTIPCSACKAGMTAAGACYARFVSLFCFNQ